MDPFIEISIELRKDRRKWPPPYLLFFRKMATPILHWSISQNLTKSYCFDTKMLLYDELGILYMVFGYKDSESPKISCYGIKKRPFLKNAPPHTPWKLEKRTPLLPGGKKRPPSFTTIFFGKY